MNKKDYANVISDRIDNENEYGLRDDGTELEAEITTPFNPKYVDIITQTMVIFNIVEKLKSNEIVLNPDFQRYDDLWNDQKRSRLIESLIIKIPLPTFYFDYSDNDESLIVVDGLQRLMTIKRFMALGPGHPEKLRLSGLEYLKEFENKTFEDLPSNIQRRIMEQTIIAYVIRPGTPESVRNSIFTRINTGGVQLTAAEIKNSVYRGRASDFLKEMAHSKEFIRATGNRIPQERMLDREFVNRFMAFYLFNINDYDDNLEEFYNKALLRIKKSSDEDLAQWRTDFLGSMRLSYILFGSKAFRRIDKNNRFSKINKPLFECVSVTFAKLNNNTVENLTASRESFEDKYRGLLKNNDFIGAITSGTATKSNIIKRNYMFEDIIKQTVGYDQIY